MKISYIVMKISSTVKKTTHYHLFRQFFVPLLTRIKVGDYGKHSNRTLWGHLIVTVENASMLKDLKKAISMMKGVTKITIPRRKLSSYERSLRDLDEGRVYKYDSLDDLIKEVPSPYSFG